MKTNNIFLMLGIIAAFFSCQVEEYAIPEVKMGLQNDCIKRTLGPNVVGLDLEFAYALAIADEGARLTSIEVEASIPGASGTFLENNSYYTSGSGDDVGIQLGEPTLTQGNTSRLDFLVDTNAATLRYYYIIPEAARGQEVSFTFTGLSSNGQRVTYDMGPYKIRKMDMQLDLPVSDADRSYISIADMAVYTAEEAQANPEKIDLVYLHRNIPNIAFNHALVAPTADAIYLPDVTVPQALTNNTKINKVWALRDFHLARLQFGVYVDDLDFEELDMSDAPNFAINLRAEAGVWVETADGKYRAYVYINTVNNNAKTAVISMKRYAL